MISLKDIIDRPMRARVSGPPGRRQLLWLAGRITGQRSYALKIQIINPGQPDHKTWVSVKQEIPAVRRLHFLMGLLLRSSRRKETHIPTMTERRFYKKIIDLLSVKK